ncbi:MAG: replication factor C small subunit [Nanoarchaeota archaeon]|nr:replication factor C small subunit [Nanoarchaeota archaeon]
MTGEVSHSIWTERFRPKQFSEVVGQEHIIKRLESFVKSKNLPHMLFSGPAGVGKTTSALIIAKELYGDNWHQNFLELNASDARGIDTVRSIIKDFCRTKAVGINLPKLLFLDEADALTKDAQHSLRRLMETYSDTARFILSCNYSSKIIDPIQSRCALFRFRPLERKDIKTILENVAQQEKITIEEEALQSIIDVAEGDARRAENILQSCASVTDNITKKIVFDVASAAEPKEVLEVLQLALNKDFQKSRNKLLDIMVNHGLSGIDIIKQIHKELWNLKIEDKQKIHLLEKCADTEFRMVEGSDEYLQLENFLAQLTVIRE